MQTVKNTHFHPSSIRRVWVNYICSDFLMQVKCLSSGAPVKKRNTLLRSYLNAKSVMHRTRYSQFVFRNNTVCSGKRRGFPVIYRQSDEARQTKPPIISFPLISPLSWAIVQPAAGPLSRRRIGWQKICAKPS